MLVKCHYEGRGGDVYLSLTCIGDIFWPSSLKYKYNTAYVKKPKAQRTFLQSNSSNVSNGAFIRHEKKARGICEKLIEKCQKKSRKMSPMHVTLKADVSGL